MVSRDYIMNVIEQLSAFVASIVLQKKMSHFGLAAQEIERAYQTLLGIDPILLRKKSFNQIVQVLNQKNSFTHENCVVAAELVRQEAETVELRDGFCPEAKELSLVALQLYSEGFSQATLRDRFAKSANQLSEKVLRYEISASDRACVARYYEASGNFGKAEDLLYELIDEKYHNAASLTRLFYARLLEKSDADLIFGNLPRKEIVDAVALL